MNKCKYKFVTVVGCITSLVGCGSVADGAEIAVAIELCAPHGGGNLLWVPNTTYSTSVTCNSGAEFPALVFSEHLEQHKSTVETN